MEWKNGAVTVAVIGVALNSACRGEIVNARVTGRGRLSGTATMPGAATLALGGER